MAKIFQADNPLNRFLYKFGSMILLNIYFLLCCLPVITVGASLTAANTVCYKMREEPDVKITSTFFKSFGKNFLDSTLVWIVLAGIMSAVVFIFVKALGGEGYAAMAVCVLCIITAIIVMSGGTFVFMILGRYSNPIYEQILNAYKVGFSHLNWCVVIWLLWAVPVLLFASFPVLLRYFGWIWLLVGFALLIYITAGVYRRVFKHVENKD